ncbi:MAG: polyprenyl synthetase family protein [Lachnospiraceae bacterium]|nr:polyprenyl synthetase family protein [Lachnospiraceae bacterium]
MNFHDELDARVNKVNDLLEGVLNIDTGLAEPLMDVMRYSVFSPGKRLRPIIMEETAALFGRDARELPFFMAALELIHSYSLVHDDMPCIDNDEFRRGRRTTHAVYGEPLALLAGDGLLNYAYETASAAFNETDDISLVARSMQVLSRKAGIFGMVGGQSVDVRIEKNRDEIGERELLYIHKKKTGALLEAAMMIGGILGGATREEIDKLKSAASSIGLAFQIRDDILDVEGNFENLGKTIGSDSANGKETYVTLFGMEKAKEDVKKYSESALETLRSFQKRNLFLEELVESLVTRNR